MLDETPVCLTSFPVVLFTDLSLTFRTMDKITSGGELLPGGTPILKWRDACCLALGCK